MKFNKKNFEPYDAFETKSQAKEEAKFVKKECGYSRVIHEKQDSGRLKYTVYKPSKCRRV